VTIFTIHCDSFVHKLTDAETFSKRELSIGPLRFW
jgi:hypothetical protein